MGRFTKISLYILLLYFVAQAVGFMFFYDAFSKPWYLFAVDFTHEELVIFRERTILPALFLTLIYFIYRYLSGRNPRSPIWPVYVVIISWVVTQTVSFFTLEKISITQIVTYIISLFILVVVRQAHLKRKNEIF